MDDELRFYFVGKSTFRFIPRIVCSVAILFALGLLARYILVLGPFLSSTNDLVDTTEPLEEVFIQEFCVARPLVDVVGL